MNYRHAYHAGNFADVFKHVILILLLQGMRKKDTPFLYLDTHAGTGRYDLQKESAGKTIEHREGIGRLWGAVPEAPFADFLDTVRTINGESKLLHRYPGSPSIARAFLRSQDRAVFVERQTDECAALQRCFASDRQVAIHCADGYMALTAQLPPKERRALVLVDPPYEASSEWDDALRGLKAAHSRFPTGVYALWYPIKAPGPARRLSERLQASSLRKVLRAECLLYPSDTAFRLNGCGMIIINPPWQLDRTLAELLPLLTDRLRQQTLPTVAVDWLVPE